MANLKDLVNELIIPDLRENALHVLSKRRDLYHEIAPLLWNTACVVTVFLQEIISIYPAVSSLELTSAQSIRVVNVLALLQVAMFVVQKVLANDNGLEYICSTAERFFAVAKVLEMVLGSLEEQPSPRLLKYVISSYSRLSHNHRAGIALVRCIPNTLMDATFINYIREDPETLKLMDVLHGNIRSNQVSSEQGGNGVEDTGGR
ncbi:CCR4-NOT transcription complex subunit [Trifolium repens]|nr:CCR4-NOT transcription complex subunit [Trifolium repens]